MPTYEYNCSKCDRTFDVFQSMLDKTLTVCPKRVCARKPWGKGKVKRLIGTGAGLIFKGSGFYITDYRSEQYKDAAKKESSSSTPTPAESKGGTTSGETKKPAVSKDTTPGATPEKPKPARKTGAES